MGLFTDIVSLFEAGYGWLFVTFLIAYELFAPTVIDRDTALAPLIRDLPAKVENIDETQDEIQEEVSAVNDEVGELKDRSKVQMQVQRAQARANPQMDAGSVDAYLLHNGVEPGEFLHGDEMGGYDNWVNPSEKNSDTDE